MNKLLRLFIFLLVLTFVVILTSKNSSTLAHHGREGYYCGVGNGHQGQSDDYGNVGGACVGNGCCDHAPYEPGNDHDFTCVQTNGGFGDGRYCSSGGGGPPPNTPIPPTSIPTPIPTLSPYTINFLGIKLGPPFSTAVGGFRLTLCPFNIASLNFYFSIPCIVQWVEE